MDLINNRTTDIAAMALDGLYERSKAISANTANALTPGYKKKIVSFEGSLQDIIKRENEKEEIKLQNSAKFAQNPTKALLAQSPNQIALLNSEINQGFKIDVESNTEESYSIDGNNVNIEEEMMAEAKTGMQYQVTASLLSKAYSELRSVITGQNS